MQLPQHQNLRKIQERYEHIYLKVWTQMPYLGKNCFTTNNVLLNGIERAAKLEVIQVT